MATNWSAGSGVHYTLNTSATITGTIIPNVGDLCIAAVGSQRATTPDTAYAISDAGSGGWTPIVPIQTSADITGQAWWKIATSADHNGGSGVLVTVVASGGTGGINQNQLTVEPFSVSGGGTVQGLDLKGARNGTGGNASFTWSPASGSGQSSNTDELAWTSLMTYNTITVAGSNTFTGTSAAANLNLGESGGSKTQNQYVGGVQASATAGTNVWKNTWSSVADYALIGATFYYTTTPANQGNMLSVMGA